MAFPVCVWGGTAHFQLILNPRMGSGLLSTLQMTGKKDRELLVFTYSHTQT